jgi:two-component system phosphate regulon sensor histidine kinase PhoR
LHQLHKRQRKARRKLTSILKRFQKSTQALPYATLVLNKANEIEWFNPAAQQMFNLNPRIDIGQRIDNLIRNPVFTEYLTKKDFDKPLKFPLNKKKIIMGITPYGNGQYLITARDITSLAHLDDMRRDFISNASHELRTPLTVMTGYLEQIYDMANEELKAPLKKTLSQTERMNKIISELIDLAKLDSSTPVDFSVKVDINALINDVYKEALSFDNDKHHIELIIDAEDSNKPATYLYGSYHEIRMALSNLMTNAIRYTPEGGTIKLFSTTHDTGIALGVQDNGIGIEQSHIARLTERFYRVDEGRSREQGGTGLGLSIVKDVLERHNASLFILSTPGKGSTFCCEFPRN